MALAIALDAHDHECSQHFAQELARVRTRYPALWERAKQRLLYEVVAGSGSPGRTMEDLMARALERYLDDCSVSLTGDEAALVRRIAKERACSAEDALILAVRSSIARAA